MAIDIQDIINKKTNHLLELLKQKKDVVKEEEPNEQPHEEEYGKENDTPIIIEEKTPMTDIVLQKIEKILDLLREKKNKNDNVNTLVETSLSVLLDVLNKNGKNEESFPQIANAILNGDDIDKPIENNKIPISSEKTPIIARLATEFLSSTLAIVKDSIVRDEIKKAIDLVEALNHQEISTNNVEQLVDISTKILEEISNIISQTPSGQVVEPTGKPTIEQPTVEPTVEPSVEPTVEQPNTQPTSPSIAASTYYNSMIKKNSDIGTFLAAAIGNALVDKKPSMIDNILSGLTTMGTVFKNYFKGIDMNDMKTRLANIPKGTSNTKLSIPATNDIFRLIVGYPLALIKYCTEKGIEISKEIIDNYKEKVVNILAPNIETKKIETKKSEINTTETVKMNDKQILPDTPQKEVNCSDPITIKLGQVEDTALCFDPKQNKIIANENKDENEDNE
jgi:hypothetical protein